MENLRIDENSRWTLGGVANDGSGDIKNARVNPITGALIVEATVTSTNTQIGSTIPGGTAGSVLFLGLGGTLAQDNANFFYDDTNNYLGLGTTTPSATLDVQGTAIITGSAGTPTFVLGRDGSGNVSNIVLGSNLTLTGGVLNATTSGSGYNQIQDDGTNITQRTTLNFVDYFTVTDGSGKTNVSINTAELGADTTLISTLETNMDLANISGQIDLSTQVTGTLSSTNIDITDLESNLDLANIAGQIDLTTQVTGQLSPTNIDLLALASDTTFITALEPNLDLANLGGQIDLASQVTGVLPLANGGTGSNLSDPGANKLLGWDDTDNSVGFWTLGAGLSYDHATHTLSANSSVTYSGGYVKTLINDITHGGGYNGKYNSGIQSIYGISNSGWSASSANLHKYDFNNQFLTNLSSATVTATKFNGAQASGLFNGQPNYAVVVGSNVYVLCGDSSNLSFTNRFYFEVYNATTLSYVGATNYISVPGVASLAGYIACCSNGTNIFVVFGYTGGPSLTSMVVTKIDASGLTISINSSSTITGTLTHGLYSSAKNSTNNNIFLGGLDNVYDISGSSATIVENVSLPTISGTNNEFLGTGIDKNIFIYNESVLEGNSYTLSNSI